MRSRKPFDSDEESPRTLKIGTGDEIGEHHTIVWQGNVHDGPQALRGEPQPKKLVCFTNE